MITTDKPRLCFCGAPAFRDARECEIHYREALARKGVFLPPRLPDPQGKP